MKEIALKESDISKLKKYPLENIISSESIIYYYKKDHNRNNILLKRLYRTDDEIVNRKIKTIESLQNSELSTYKELVLPEDVATIQGRKSAFTIQEVHNSNNLHLWLEDDTISNERKIKVLKKIGKLLQKVQCQSQEFYFVDLQDYNFLVDEDDNIYAIDLDSSSVSQTQALDTRYLSIDPKAHYIYKYHVTDSKKAYPSTENDIFCYNTMVLNFLAGISINRMDYAEYYNYIKYLKWIGIPKEMIEIYNYQYTDKKGELVSDYLEDLPNDMIRGKYSVYKALQKQKRVP